MIFRWHGGVVDRLTCWPVGLVGRPAPGGLIWRGSGRQPRQAGVFQSKKQEACKRLQANNQGVQRTTRKRTMGKKQGKHAPSRQSPKRATSQRGSMPVDRDVKQAGQQAVMGNKYTRKHARMQASAPASQSRDRQARKRANEQASEGVRDQASKQSKHAGRGTRDQNSLQPT